MEKHKCYYDEKSFFHSCVGMSKMLEIDKNITIPLIMNLTNGKERNAFVGIKSTKKEKGLSFNFCPFCREDILNNHEQLNTNKIPYYEISK